MGKYADSDNVFKFLGDIDSNKKMKNKKNKFWEQYLIHELNSSYKISSENFECLDAIDGNAAIAWYFCTQKYKQIPCSYYTEKTYDVKLVNFFKENGELVYRKIYDQDDYGDLIYIFFYKECYFLIVLPFWSEELSINSLTVYHPVNVSIDFSEISKFEIIKKEIPKIGIIKTTRSGPAVTYIDHTTNLKFNYNNYNEDFPDFYEDLKVKLSGDVKTGLYLFYGEAGTGKSSAIRQLISDIDRSVVFIPPQMINSLSSPEFTDLVTGSLKNSILVIEDAEKALMKRETQDGYFNSELVSSILNLTDGLYADLAQTAIIATYNCDRNMIDPALLRKGRLRSEYQFKKLSLERTQKLMDDLGYNVEVEEEMTLADIFNYKKQFSNKKKEVKRSVGFGG